MGNLPHLDVDVTLLHARDAGLLAEIVRMYGPVLAAVLRPTAVDRHHLDDLIQGFWAHLLPRLDRYTGRTPFGPWFVHVAKNYRNSCARREAKTAARTADLEEALDLLADPDALDDEAQRRSLEEATYEALDRLPDRQREAVILTVVDDRSDVEAGKIMGVGAATVANLVRRALFTLHGEGRLRKFHEDL